MANLTNLKHPRSILLILLVLIFVAAAPFGYRILSKKRAESVPEKSRMCDWNCGSLHKPLLYIKVVGESEFCPEEITITKDDEELKCTLLGTEFWRTREEIEGACREGWVMCEDEI